MAQCRHAVPFKMPQGLSLFLHLAVPDDYGHFCRSALLFGSALKMAYISWLLSSQMLDARI